ncbi:hypothetical protein M2271_006438 [Streptomyces sp. LBL]|nr:hypothetical protein [Streptomyces sp. LBL]
MDEDGQPFGAFVPCPADVDAGGAAGPQQGPGLVGRHSVCRAAVHAPVGGMVTAEHAQCGAEEALRAVHDLCHGDQSPLCDLGEGRGQVRLGCGIDALDEDVEFAAAGQADREGVVVGVAEPGPLRSAPVVQHLSAQFVHRALDAAAGDAADRVAVLVHRDRRTDRQGCAAVHVDDGGQGEGASLAAPAVQCVRDVQHVSSPRQDQDRKVSGPLPRRRGKRHAAAALGGPAAGRGQAAGRVVCTSPARSARVRATPPR